jgi:sister-chromatid-cohesion protein PDS5
VDPKRDVQDDEDQHRNPVNFLLLLAGIKLTRVRRPVIEEVLAEYILPLPSSSTPSTSKSTEVDEVAWTDRLLTVMAFLDDDQAVNTLLSMSGVQRGYVTSISVSIADFPPQTTHHLSALR